MKKIAILILSILIAGLFVACNQDITVDAQTYANMEVGTFVLNGQNYATLQEAVNAKLGKSAKALGGNDGVIYLTRNASGPGAVIDVSGTPVIIDFAGYTYSFTNVTGLQGGDNPKADTFGLGITNGADVTLKGLEQIDLNDRSTTDLTMVYVAGQNTKLTIEDAPKMKVEDDQYVFWAADGATLTIGSEDKTKEATITGRVAATGGTTEESKPTITLQGSTKVTGVVEVSKAEVEIVGSSEVTGSISTTGSNITVGDESKIKASLTASDFSTVTIVSKDNIITNLDKTLDSKIITAEDLVVEEVATTSEDKKIETTDAATIYQDEGKETESIDVISVPVQLLAKIGNTLYETFDAALETVIDSTPTTIVLLGDYKATISGITIGESKNITVDLNGWSVGSSESHVTLHNNGSLTIEDSWAEADKPSVVYIGSEDYQPGSSSQFTVTGGTYIFNPEDNDFVPAWCSVEEVASGFWTVSEIKPETAVASITRENKTLYFKTLNDAFDASLANEEVVLLANNISVDSYISVNHNVSLNLNGKTLYNNVEDSRLFRVYNSTLTVNGNYGKMIIPDTNTGSYGFIDFRSGNNQYSGKEKVVIYDTSFIGATAGGSFFQFRQDGQTLELYYVDCDNYTVDNPEKHGNYYVGTNASIVNGYGVEVSLKVVGGTYKYSSLLDTYGVFQVGKYDVSKYMEEDSSTAYIADGTTVIAQYGPILEGHGIVGYKDCIFSFTTDNERYYESAISVALGSSVLTVNGGEYSGTYGAYVWSSGGEIDIIDGTITGTSGALYAQTSVSSYPNAEAKIKVSGGSFDGKIIAEGKALIEIKGGTFTKVSFDETGLHSEYPGIVIKGGTFDANPSAYVAEGYVVVQTGTNEWTVKESEEVTVVTATKTETMSLARFRNNWNDGYYSSGFVSATLTADVVDISGSNWYPIGTWEFPFYGTFNGGSHTIKGLYAHSTDSENVGTYANNSTVGFGETFGFFGIVGGANTTVENIVFTDVDINIYNGKNVGSVIGYAPSNSKFKAASSPTGDDSMVNIEPYKSSSTFENKWKEDAEIGTHAVKLSGITVSGTIKGTSAVGGIAGKLYTSGKVEVLSCTNNANITGGSNTSGIVGYIYYSSDITVSGCVNAGNVVLTGGAGIVNFNDLGNKKITNNSNSGNIIYNASYTKTSANSYSWDFIAGGVHNNRVYSEYSGNVNTGKFYIQDNEEPESTKGVLIVDTNETVTINSVSEYTDIIVNGTLNINAATSAYGCVWVDSTGTINVNAPLTVNGTQGTLNLKNSSLTVGGNGSISAYYITVPENYEITNYGTIRITASTTDPNAASNGLKKSNLTVVNNGTFIAESNMFYGNNLNFTNNGTYQGNMLLTGNATVINTEHGTYHAHNGNGIDFRGGSGSFTNDSSTPFGEGFDGISIWVAGSYTVVGANAHLGSGVTNLILTKNGDTYTATNK